MKTIGVFQLDQKVFEEYEFSGLWEASFGRPEKNFSCIIYGESGAGKTDFAVKLAKYLAGFTKVLYYTREEGISSTIQKAFRRNNMKEVSGKVIPGEYDKKKGGTDFQQIWDYLGKRNSPGAVILDSLDYMRFTADQWKALTEKFSNKAFIILSWSAGKLPKSQAGKDIEYMVDMKLFVKNYLVHPRSRFGGNKPFVIWEERARELNPPEMFTASIAEREEMLEVEDTLQMEMNFAALATEGENVTELVQAEG